MQEEVESRTVTLVISATKLTGRVLKAAIARLLKELEKDLARIEKSAAASPAASRRSNSSSAKMPVFPTSRSPTATSNPLKRLPANTAWIMP